MRISATIEIEEMTDGQWVIYGRTQNDRAITKCAREPQFLDAVVQDVLAFLIAPLCP